MRARTSSSQHEIVRRRRPGARLWCRLGRARPRRRSARRRHLAPAGASDPRATVRPARPARPGRHGLGHVDPSRVSAAIRPRVQGRFEGVSYFEDEINDFPAWPRPVTTDPEGRFTLRGVGRDLHAVLAVHHPRFALQTIEVETDGASESKTMTAALAPAQIITGRVTYADTGKGSLMPRSGDGQPGEGRHPRRFETDDEGRFRVNPPPADRSYNVTAFPPEGQPYLIASEAPRVAQGSGRAVPRPRLAARRIDPRQGHRGGLRQARRGGDRRLCVSRRAAESGEPERRRQRPHPTARFSSGSSPARVTSSSRAPATITCSRRSAIGCSSKASRAARRIYAHAHTLLDLKPGIDSQEVHVVLRRGATVKGQVVGPDGQPVRDAWIFSRIILDPRPGRARSWNGRHHGKVHDGRFEVHGLDPDAEVPVYFLDPKQQAGRRRQPLGQVGGRRAGHRPARALRRRQGEGRRSRRQAGRRDVYLVTDRHAWSSPPVRPAVPRKARRPPLRRGGDLTSVDPVNYEKELVCDAEGRHHASRLDPGATYRFIDYTAGREAVPQVRKEFTVKPGETIDLGDILVENPPR